MGGSESKKVLGKSVLVVAIVVIALMLALIAVMNYKIVYKVLESSTVESFASMSDVYMDSIPIEAFQYLVDNDFKELDQNTKDKIHLTEISELPSNNNLLFYYTFIYDDKDQPRAILDFSNKEGAQLSYGDVVPYTEKRKGKRYHRR